MTEKETEKAIICLLNHFDEFRRQASENKTADFGKPCSKCELWKDCKGDWIPKIGRIRENGQKVNCWKTSPRKPNEKRGKRNVEMVRKKPPYHI